MVSGLQSDGRGGGGVVRLAPRFAYTGKFYKVFLFYLAIGITVGQYWDGDCELVRYYRKAAKIRQDLKSQGAQLQGMYIYQAASNLAPILRAFARKSTKTVSCPDQPFVLSTMQEGEREQAKQEKQDRKAKTYSQALTMSLNKKFQEKGGGINDRQCGNSGSEIPNPREQRRSCSRA